ncbi:MAG: nuclear transport factor 2 family protein [Myxococcales bacterium]|nr:MAG: nuclear transport factor 2 family protein [Myxococcales bacterium]
MSVADHKETVREYFAAIGRCDRAAMRALVTEDLVWVVPRSAPPPFGGVHRGAEHVIGMMVGAVSEAFLPGSQRTEFTAMVGEGDLVMAEAQMRARAPRGDYENGYCFVVSFRGGRIAEIREHVDTIAAARFFAPELGGGGRQ